MDIERIGELAMEIISYAGTAKSHCILALEAAKQGQTQEVEKNFHDAEDNFAQAHDLHKDILSEELNTKEPRVSMLLMHAEDQLMSAETIRFVVQEFIALLAKKENAYNGNL